RATALGQGSSPTIGRGSRSAAAQHWPPTWGPGARPLARGVSGGVRTPPDKTAGAWGRQRPDKIARSAGAADEVARSACAPPQPLAATNLRRAATLGYTEAKATNQKAAEAMDTNLSQQVANLHVREMTPLESPEALKQHLPLSPAAAQTVTTARESIRRVLRGEDRRMLVVIGPYSIHDPEAALDYARRLQRLHGEPS